MSCSKKDEITVDKMSFTFTQEGETGEFNISYTGEWHLEATGLSMVYGSNLAILKDFNIMPAAGTGNAKVTVRLENPLTENYEIALKVVGKDNQTVITLKAIAD
jgi:hypothetical protein